jgi:predicted Rossmann fold flavoprotein
MPVNANVAIVGAGAAGLFAAIHAARTLRASGSSASVIAVDGGRKLGAKILVAGGGRCNVTHHAVDETAYAGSSRNAIKNVLRRFGVRETVEFFREYSVELKREETGKLFPTTDDAHSVLNALLKSAHDARVDLVHPWRVESLERRSDGGFVVRRRPEATSDIEVGGRTAEEIHARRVILATGGLALPKTGSDGHGHAMARALGHTITPRVFPALVPLTVDKTKTFLPELSGLTLDATVELWSPSGKKLQAFTNSTLLTHFGLSGPGILDISRYYTDAKRDDAGATLSLNFVPGMTFDQLDAFLAADPRVSIGRRLGERVPERLARALCESAGVDPSMLLSRLTRDARRELAHQVTRYVVPVSGDRGYTYAEVTAGGVPLAEVHLSTMESRVCPGLYLCGEICDVDGRIGGFNFQWAWASGFVAGVSAAKAVLSDAPPTI